jgi:hypothetical protein
VAQRYVSLIERARYADAANLWDDRQVGKEILRDEERGFSDLTNIHFELDAPRGEEGAAGSIYITIPVEISAKDKKTGAPVIADWKIVLRRSNDVPGTSAEQRTWHIHEAAPPDVS